MKEKKFWDDLCNFLNGNKEWWSQAIAGLLEFTFQIRKYDLAPDVMIYTNRFPPGFPNGRLLTDDVNAIVCATGDCLLQELSFIERQYGRARRSTTRRFLPTGLISPSRGRNRRRRRRRPEASGLISSRSCWCSPW